jgi:general secretion pathway protein C
MLFHAALRRSFGGQILALLAAAAYYQASGVTQLVSSALGAHDSDLPSLDAAHMKAAASLDGHDGRGAEDHATSADWILQRNPFDSVTPRPLDAPAIAIGAAGVKRPQDPNAYVCQGVKAVVVMAARDPECSMAALTVGDATRPRLVRVGDGIGGGRKVELIEWNRVVLSLESRLCETRMFRSNQQDSADTASAQDKADVATGPISSDITSKIRKIRTNEFEVDREAVDRILESYPALMKTVRIVPEQENGRGVGLRLFGIPPDSLLAALGLENGDRLRSINGFDLSSPETALEAYARLRTAHALVLDINRRGQNQSIQFAIQ